MTFPETDNPADDEYPNQDQSGSFYQEDQEESSGDDSTRDDSIVEDDSANLNFPSMEDDVANFRRQLDERRFVADQRIPEEESVSVPVQPARRRRRSQRLTDRMDANELTERFASIVQRAAPTFDFFIFSILSGCIIGIGYLLDAPAILIIGILVAPLLAPWVGLIIGAASGETRFFGQTLGGLLTALALVFGVGFLAGLASRIFQPLTSTQAFYHARLWWPDLLMLVVGTIILVLAFIQSDSKPLYASLMVAYQFYLPINAAGFGLGSGVSGLWPEAGLVFCIHLFLSLMIGLVIFYYLGFRPQKPSGYLLPGAILLVGFVVIAGFAGIGSLINVRGDKVPTANPATATIVVQDTATTTVSQIIQPASIASPVATITPTVTETTTTTPLASNTQAGLINTPTFVVTPGPTLLPTPVYGRVYSQTGGVMVRVKPAGGSITTVQNGYLVEFLNDKPVTIDGVTWIHVLIKTPIRDIDGWVIMDLIVTATPFGSP